MRLRIPQIGLPVVGAIVVLAMLLGATTIPVLANPSPIASVSPASQSVGPGDTFSITIVVAPDGEGLSAGQLDFAFDATAMQVDSVTAGNLFGANPTPAGLDLDNVAGTVSLALARKGFTTPPTPTGTFATITLTVNEDAPEGTYALDITNLRLADETFVEITGIAINDGAVTIADEMPPTYSTIITVPASPTVYVPGQNYTFSITVLDNVAVETVVFQFEGVNHTNLTNVGDVYSYQLTDLAAGTYTYRWYMNDTSDNWNSTPNLGYIINQAATTVTLLLNGVEGDLVIDPGEPVNLSATLSIPDILTLSVDGIAVGTEMGSVELENVTTLDLGPHNVTASYPGDGNYTGTSATHWVTVTYPWDINADGTVDFIDMTILSAHWDEVTTEPYPRYDLNRDGTVNYIDLAILSAHMGETYW
ncbi:MAG TPA: hypothetical protein ENN68_04420 [Methanomicrobia archaeon]|nr:hypothetical protein [Methanomicrobia archaeon]